MKRLSLVLALAVLGGCATVDSTTQPVAAIEQNRAYSALSELNYQPVQVYEKAIRVEQTLNRQSQWTDAGGVPSPVASWKLPGYGVYRFKLESFVARHGFGSKASSFVPELWLLDGDYQPLQKLSAERLSYDEQAMLSRESLSQEFIIDNRNEDQPQAAYLIALATEASMKQVFQVANFDEQYAKVRARSAYPSGDVFAKPTNEGVIRLTITPLVSQKSTSVNIPPAPVPDHVPAPQSAAPQSSPTDLKQISQDFVSGIETALTEGDIQQAMEMRNAAKALNAQLHSYFAENYGEESPADIVTIQEGVAEENLHRSFFTELNLELQRGRAQNALAILDLSSRMVRNIDAAF